jgi:hypothetical protein
MAKSKRRFYILYMQQGRERVWLAEWLQTHELKARLRKGWKIAYKQGR